MRYKLKCYWQSSLKLLYYLLLLLPVIGFGSNIRNGIQVSGSVKSNGIGLSNVSVSDGKIVVRTDDKGRYSLLTDTTTSFIFISTPSNYKISMTGENVFFYRINAKNKSKHNVNFNLFRQNRDDSKHSLIVCADPQVGYESEIPLFEKIIDDIKKYSDTIKETQNVYGIVCGDLVEGLNQKKPTINDIIKQFSSVNFPFFYLAGNHDLDFNNRSNENSKRSFEKLVGPTYYSFNRGKVHYVVLDDVFYTGRSNNYIGYISEKQLKWLEQDLLNVRKGAILVISLHIPTFSKAARKGEFNKEEINKIVQNRSALYEIVKDYKVHIMSGHEHYQENYLIRDNIYEHVHPALCGVFWQAPYNSDGTPIGYTIYEFDEDQIKWHYKAVGRSREESQFNAYTIGSDEHKPESFIVNLWNYDPSWKVYWYEDNKKMGEMVKYDGWDPNLVAHVHKYKSNFRYKNIGAGITSHLFYATPYSTSSNIEIEVIDRFDNIYRMKPKKIKP